MAEPENFLEDSPPTPVFSLAAQNFDAIADALETVGHVILENCLSHRDVAELRDFTVRQFERNDAAREAGQIPTESLSGYFSGQHDLDVVNNALLIEMVGRSRLPSLMTYLYGGPAMMFLDERAVRRADMRFPLRHVGFHRDVQLSGFSSNTHTIWTPLTELGPDCSALTLFHRGFDDDEDLTKLGLTIEQIQEFDEPKEKTADREANLLAGYRTLYEKYARLIHFPKPEIGDVILFSPKVLHGSQVSPDATRQRLSLDFRWSAAFDWNANPAFAGRKAVMFEPGDGAPMTFVPPDTEVECFETTNQARAVVQNLRDERVGTLGQVEELKTAIAELYQRLETCVALPPVVARFAARLSGVKAAIKGWLAAPGSRRQ